MDIVKQSVAITVVFGLLALALWLLKKKGIASTAFVNRRSGRQYLEVVERIRLTPQHSIQLVRVRDRQLLIGVHPSGFALLSDLSTPARRPELLTAEGERQS